MFSDLRVFLSKLEEMQELKVVEGADWNEELTRITYLVNSMGGPALLFDKIKDYPKGYRVLANAYATQRRAALILGLPIDAKPIELIKEWKRRLKEQKPIPPTEVSDGPVMENVQRGDAVDLYKFPSPKFMPLDGGRYLGTGDMVFLRDPDEGWVNVGVYRVMVVDRNTATILIASGKHGRAIMQKYHSRGQNCPVSISLGQPPSMWFAAASNVPWGQSEMGYIGNILGRAMEYIPGPITGLPIPKGSEAALEGEIPPYEKESHDEGPFNEWPGYYTRSGRSEVIHVKAVYHRNDPIITSGRFGEPPHTLSSIIPLNAALVWNQMEAAGISDITGVYSHLFLTNSVFLTVSIRQRYPGQAMQTALAAASCRAGAKFNFMTVVVDDDVDPANLEEVLWAMATRCDPAQQVKIVGGGWYDELDPVIPPERKEIGDITKSRMIIDACIPFHRRNEYPPRARFPRAQMEETYRKWKSVLG